MLSRLRAITGAALLNLLLAASAQSTQPAASKPAQLLHPDGPRPSFEVATIKPLDPSMRVMVSPLGSQQIVRIVGAAEGLAGLAYNIRTRPQLVGALGWSDSKQYVVQAKIPDELFVKMQDMTSAQRRQQTQLMLQSLLADRFQLKVHFASLDMPIYELVQDKGGAKLPPPVEPPIPAGGGWAISPQGKMRVGNMKLDELLQSAIFGLGDRPIVNRTGLNGTYNLTLNWKPIAQPGAPAADNFAAPAAASADSFLPAADDSSPSIFTVLQEQLGLKLVPSRGPVETLVIDHIEEKPTDN